MRSLWTVPGGDRLQGRFGGAVVDDQRIGRCAFTEAIVTIEWLPRAYSCGSAARVVRSAATKLDEVDCRCGQPVLVGDRHRKPAGDQVDMGQSVARAAVLMRSVV